MGYENETSRVITRSIWPEPGQRFTRFLEKLETTQLPKTLAVLGCADGTYVLPAARKGFKVLAIDKDPVSLYGNGENVIGLLNRVRTEKVEDLVTVVEEDIFSYQPEETFSGVFTSGSIHYEGNEHYTLPEMMRHIQSFVSPGGVLLFEYIHRAQENNDKSKHYVTSREVRAFFDNPDWTVTSNKKRNYTEKPNPRNPKEHTIIWGRLYAKKRSSNN